MITRTFNKWLMKTLCRIAERYIMERGDEENIYLTMCVIKLPEDRYVRIHFNNNPMDKDHIEGFQDIVDPRDKVYEVVKQGKEIVKEGDKNE